MLPGTPTLYYGDELGMQDVPVPFHEQHDPQGLNMPGKNLSRDHARTPMQWNERAFAGFSESKPWLPVDKFFIVENVNTERMDKSSMLSLYHKLILLRQKELSLMAGNYELVYADRQCFAFTRSYPGCDRFLIALNLTHRQCAITLPSNMSGIIEIATIRTLEKQEVNKTIYLSGDEGIIARLNIQKL